MNNQFAASIDYTYKHSISSADVKTQGHSYIHYEVSCNRWFIFLAHLIKK